MKKEKLIRFAQNGTLVFQEANLLIEASRECSGRLIDFLEKADEISVVNREDMFDSAFDELVKWSIPTDTLLLADSGVLICMSETLKKEFDLSA